MNKKSFLEIKLIKTITPTLQEDLFLWPALGQLRAFNVNFNTELKIRGDIEDNSKIIFLSSQ